MARARHDTSTRAVPNAPRRDFLRNGGRALAALAALTLPGTPARAMAAQPAMRPIRPQISRHTLAARLTREFGLPEKQVAAVLQQAHFIPGVIERMEAPYEARPWHEYRPLFVTRRLAAEARDYIRAHMADFRRARERYGVQPEIIAAILGMETHFGRHRGRDRVLDALYTLAAGYPRRADFFRKELGHFILLCREEGLKPDSLVGSYAGAFGVTQFIPSSYRAYAVDADGDGRRDVWHSTADITASVAHYFHAHGWDAARPVARWMPPLTDRDVVRAMRRAGMRQWMTLKHARPALPPLPAVWRDDDRVSLIRLDTNTGPRDVLVHYNFYVITRWNRSANYAMAATELAAMAGCALCDTHEASRA